MTDQFPGPPPQTSSEIPREGVISRSTDMHLQESQHTHVIETSTIHHLYDVDEKDSEAAYRILTVVARSEGGEIYHIDIKITEIAERGEAGTTSKITIYPDLIPWLLKFLKEVLDHEEETE